MPKWDTQQIERIAREVVDIAVKIHTKLGPGLLESAYVHVLVKEIVKRGMKVRTEVPVRLIWEGEDLGVAYRIDILVEELVIIEVKSTRGDAKVHAKQALTYLRLTGLPLALVLNFAHALMKDGIQRVANEYFADAA
jgi:iron complex transport system substrate-binding protein